MTEGEELLAAALLWLRNHYEVGDRTDQVLQRIDAVLTDYPPTIAMMQRWGTKYAKLHKV